MRSNFWRLLAPATGPLAVLLTVLGIFVWHPGIAQAAPALSFQGSCTPDTVRPAAAALITCTVSVTNTGDSPALNLAAQPSAPSAPCAIASPIYIDRTINGVSVPASGTRYNLGNLAPQAMVTSITRLAIINQGSGMKGTKVTVFSQADPSIQASGDVCWNVDASASEPSFRMEVTKTPLTGDCFTPPISGPATLTARSRGAQGQRQPSLLGRPIQAPDPQGFFGCPQPPRPDYGGPVPISPPDPTPGLVEFEIAVTNMSGPAVLDVSVLDVETGSGAFVQSDPPPTGTDFLGRPVWNVGTLNQGEEYRIVASYGAQQPDRCLMAYDVAVVTSTPSGGSAENYAAFPGTGQQVGNCEGGGSSELCWHYPPEDQGFAETERCDVEVCWIPFEFGGGEVFWEPHFGDCTQETCRFLPPEGVDGGYEPINPCDSPLCWGPYGPSDFSYYEPTGCDQDTCQHTAPDGITSYYERCGVQFCWSMPPGSSAWEAHFFGDCQIASPCWFMPPGKGEAALDSCNQDLSEVCWATDFFFGIPDVGTPTRVSTSSPIAQSGSDEYRQLPCDFVFCKYTAPDGITAYNDYCENEPCWSIAPEGGAWQSVGFNCQSDGYWCWYTPSVGASVLNNCSDPVCFVTPPEGAIPFYYGGEVESTLAASVLPIYCGITDYCWAVPSGDPDLFVAYGVPCDTVGDLCWGTPPNGTATFPVDCGVEFCWVTWPSDYPPPAEYGFPADQMVPVDCPQGETGEMGSPGTSAPFVTEEATSTEADLSPGTVEEQSPVPSDSKSPATFSPGTSETVDSLPSSDVIPVEIARPDLVDYDGDGCNNLHERGFETLTGGLRDPENVWDFFDTPGAGNARDGSITAADIARVVQRFGRNGSPGMDPLSMPPAPPNYHTAFDRMPDGEGADGAITTQDIAVEVAQFGNSCL